MATTDLPSESWQFRSVTTADIQRLSELEQELFLDPWTPGMIAGELREALGINEILLQGETILGYYFLSMLEDEAELHNIAVPKNFQKLGVGTFILKNIVNRCDANGIERLYLEVRDDNISAIRLYEKMSFECIGRRPGYYSVEKKDALIYMRTKHELV